MLELRQLTVLEAIARAGSMAGAARALHYSQPTVAHHLAALESHLGVELVSRSTRGANLTDLGQLFLEHADAVLDRLRSAEAEVKALARHGVATLRIGTFPTAGAHVLPRAVAALQVRTDVRVELHEAEPPELVERLLARELHCALIYDDPESPVHVQEEIFRVSLFDDPFRLVLPASHPLAERRSVGLSDLVEDGWMMSRDPDEPGDAALRAACAAEGFAPRPVLRTDDYDVMFGFVAAGVGVALVPQMALVERAGVVVRPLAHLNLRRSVRFVSLREGAPPAVRVLLSALRAGRAKG
ncbi:MAG: LysR family transcriptional regulator [Actinomycetes bacterium]